MTWLAPAFLAGLLAIGLPLWLHRLSSENPNRQAFSSLMFLEPGEPRRVLARRLQYWLLLALRIAVIAFAALAFAGPAVIGARSSASGDAAKLDVLVIDGSASMRLGDRWARAKRAALEVIDALGPADQLELVLAGRRLERIAAPSGDRTMLRQRVATLEPTFYSVDYGQTMLGLDGLTRNVEQPIVLTLVTDAQRTSLPTRFADLAPRRPMRLVIRDVGAADEENWSVDALTGSAQDGVVSARLTSYASEDAEKTVVLELNGEPVARKAVTIPAHGHAEVTLPGVDLQAGPNRLELALEPGDPLASDDVRYLVLERAQPQSVLLISNDQRGRDTLYLTSAMETLDDLKLEVDRETPSALASLKLADYAFVVVTDAGILSDAQSERLSDYVEAGGALWLAFGPRSSTLTQVPVTGHRLQGFVQGGASRDAPAVGIGSIDTQHPGLGAASDLRRAKIFRYVTIVDTPEDSVPVRLEGGAPLLLERELGAGRVLLFASTLDRQWNDLPVAPVFVPFVAGLARELAGSTRAVEHPALGSTLSLAELGLQGGQIFDPSGRQALGLAGTEGDVLLDRIGFYEAQGGGRTKVVAVNLDPKESDITRIDPAELERWRALSRPSDAAGAPTAAGGLGARAIPLWPWLLALLAAAAVMESLVGNWHLRVRRGMAT